VELEHDWEHGLPRSLEYYRTLFPDAFADQCLLREIGFEEYRLRRQAGQDPDPEEYARNLGINTGDWPPRQGLPEPRTVNIRAAPCRREVPWLPPHRGAGPRRIRPGLPGPAGRPCQPAGRAQDRRRRRR